MNSAEFLQEVLESGLAPGSFENCYSEFQEYQRLAAEVLCEFHRICEEEHILYELAYGSLLGAIRDHGQIPWDYDIDVFVPIEQKQRLIDALALKLPNKYYYYCPEKDKNCRHVIMRVSPVGYRSEVLHVDVFFVSGTPDNIDERKKYVRKIKKLAFYRYLKLVNAREETDKIKSYIKVLIYKSLVVFVDADKIYTQYNLLTEKYPAIGADVCVEADSYADYLDFPGRVLWDTKIIETDIGQFRIPKNYDVVLSKMYGDYMKVPSLETRLYEMMNHLAKIKKFQSF